MLLLIAAAFAAAPSTLWVEAPDAADRRAAAAVGLAWAEGTDGDWILVEGTPEQAERAGLRWRLAAEDPEGWSPSPEEVEERLRGLGTVVQIGESVLGRPILAVRFGEGPRALRILGGHHGDEGASVEVALRVAEALANGGVPEGTEVWVVPLVNPDGLAAGTRANANGVDLNRNYGEQWNSLSSTSGDGPFSEPETRAIRALARARSFDAGLSLHSGAANLGWVWNWTSDTRPDDEPALAAIAADYADACGAPDFWITEGADWYVTYGDTTDWTYGQWGAWDYTLEVSEVKSPPAEEVETYVAWHLDAILAWIARVPEVTGMVTDAATGEGIPAEVGGEGTRSWSTGPSGVYARWSAAGTEVSAPGYATSAELALEPVSLLDVLPEPRLLSRGAGPTAVRLVGVGAGDLLLSQPGEPDVTVAADAKGTWTIDPSTLAPGAWTLTVAEGVVPRGLFVGEVDDRVELTSATIEDGVLQLEGVGFGEGAEAWSIGGPARAFHPLSRVEGDEDSLSWSLSGDDEDVLVWTNGAWLSAVDLYGSVEIDRTAPPEAEPESQLVEAEKPETVATTCATGSAGAGWVIVALGLVWRRRPTRARGACELP